MIRNHYLIRILLLSSLLMTASSAIARNPAHSLTPQVGVGAQYDTTHVYVAPDDVDKFVASFLATFGGQSTKQVVATVTPTPSSTTSQLLQTPVGTVSCSASRRRSYPFEAERTGYLVTDMDEAIRLRKRAAPTFWSPPSQIRSGGTPSSSGRAGSTCNCIGIRRSHPMPRSRPFRRTVCTSRRNVRTLSLEASCASRAERLSQTIGGPLALKSVDPTIRTAESVSNRSSAR